LNTFKTITFTHANVGIDQVADFFIDEASYGPRLSPLKKEGLVDGVMILSTCNRVEFYFNTDYSIDSEFLSQFFKLVYPDWNKERVAEVVTQTNVLSEEDAVRHLFNVASSLDSLVIGEREIITQFRKAYDNCCKAGLTNAFLRLATRKTIETAKRVFTETEISNKPTSVVNLAARLLKGHNIPEDARVVVVGAGVTNQALLRQMSKSGFRNTFVYNRTLSKAEELAQTVNGIARPLSDLIHHQEGMDVLLTCTGAPGNIITPDLYDRLVGHDTNHKIVVDLAVPNDFDHTILHKHAATLIEVSSLKQIAEKNLESRKQHLDACL
jgi:glutamyl-tRNA reductase